MQTSRVCSDITPSPSLKVNAGPGVPIFLAECSPRDARWDSLKSDAERLASIYGLDPAYRRLAERVRECAPELAFGWAPDKRDPNALTLTLKRAWFCRVRLCPICQWRRSRMWCARFHKALPTLMREHPTACFIFLTLTCRNVDVAELRNTMKLIAAAWRRLLQYRKLRCVRGWVRGVEVKRAKDGLAHPHVHVLFVVPRGYFTGHSYIRQEVWVHLWRTALRIDYNPVCHVERVKGDLSAAVRETLKYATKPSELVADREWALQLTTQLHKLRSVASGGVLKEALRESQESNDELVHLNGEQGNGGDPEVFFRFNGTRYRRKIGAAL
jgi:plasmid rolling circle replication initiator protein Rep